VWGFGFRVPRESGARLSRVAVEGTPRTRVAKHARCSQFENNYFTEMCSSSEAGSYLRLIDVCITPL